MQGARVQTTRRYVFATFAALILSGCGGEGGGGNNAEPPVAYSYSYTSPVQREDGWLVGDAASEGLDMGRLAAMMKYIHDSDQDSYMRSILIVRNRALVFEEYFRHVGIDTNSHLQSATKSFVSTIFGIAVANGYVASVDEAMFDFFPEYQHLNDAEKAAITLQHVLSMTPGLEWNENSAPINGPENDNIAAYRSNNYIEYLLKKDVVTEPGTAWNYNSGCPMLLAGIIRNQSGMHIDEFAEQHLFGPLGIEGARWEYQADGLPLATGGLWLHARGSAKLGQVFLDGGVWNGKQVIAPEWVEASWTPHATPAGGRGYGYLWWSQTRAGYPLWYAAGYGGQLIITVPGEGVVIVMNADYSSDPDETGRRSSNIWNLVSNYLLQSI